MIAPEVRPATLADVLSFYGARPTTTVKAYVAELDGEVIGIGGIEYVGMTKVAFIWAKPELKAYPILMTKFARKIVNENSPVIALPDPEEPTADRFLTHLGFERQGEIYIHV